jgi:hypothetical protein
MDKGFFMLQRLTILVFLCFFLLSTRSNASSEVTVRTAQFSNDKVSVWGTVIYPSANQLLKMHRHEHDRIVVAFNNGLLKITNDKGRAHYLKLEKGKAYYLPKDIPNELHNDSNMSSHPVKVLVVELRN